MLKHITKRLFCQKNLKNFAQRHKQNLKRITLLTSLTGFGLRIYTKNSKKNFENSYAYMKGIPEEKFQFSQVKDLVYEFYENGQTYKTSGIYIGNGFILVNVSDKKVSDSIKKQFFTLKKSSDFGKNYKSKKFKYEVVEDLSKSGFLVVKLSKNLKENPEIKKNEVKIGEEFTFLSFHEGKPMIMKGIVQENPVTEIQAEKLIYYPLLPSFKSTLLGRLHNKDIDQFYAFDDSNKIAGICKKFTTHESSDIHCISPSQVNIIAEKLYEGEKPELVKFDFSVKTDNSQEGVFIFNTVSGGIADKIGLKMGDTIMELNGARVQTVAEFVSLCGFGFSQNSLNFGLLRDNEFIELNNCKI